MKRWSARQEVCLDLAERLLECRAGEAGNTKGPSPEETGLQAEVEADALTAGVSPRGTRPYQNLSCAARRIVRGWRMSSGCPSDVPTVMFWLFT